MWCRTQRRPCGREHSSAGVAAQNWCAIRRTPSWYREPDGHLGANDQEAGEAAGRVVARAAERGRSRPPTATKSAAAADDRTREMPVSRRQQAAGRAARRGRRSGGRVRRHRAASPPACCSALAIYFDLAGVLGEAIEQGGRLVHRRRPATSCPIALVCVGVALVRTGRSEHRCRLIVGWGLGVVRRARAAARVPRSGCVSAGFDERRSRRRLDRRARRGSRCARSSPRPAPPSCCSPRSLGGDPADHRHVAAHHARWSRGDGVATGGHGGCPRRPAWRSAKVRGVFGNMASLKSDRDATPGGTPLPAPTALPAPRSTTPMRDDDWSDVAPKRHAPAKALPPPAVTDGAVEQVELELGPGAQRGQWMLPPANYLTRSAAQTVNQAEVEARGRTLVESLASHGVETRLVGMTVGPTVTRYELELGPGVKVARVTSLQQGHRLRHGGRRRAHPGPDPGPLGHRRRGAQPHPPARRASATSWRSAEAKRGHPPARGRRRQGHRRPVGVPQPGHHAAPADRRRHRRRQVERHQLHHHVAADAHHARPGAADPRSTRSRSRWASTTGCRTCSPRWSPTRRRRPTRSAGRCKEMERRYDLLSEVGFRDITGYNAAFDRGELQHEMPRARPARSSGCRSSSSSSTSSTT